MTPPKKAQAALQSESSIKPAVVAESSVDDDLVRDVESAARAGPVFSPTLRFVGGFFLFEFLKKPIFNTHCNQRLRFSLPELQKAAMDMVPNVAWADIVSNATLARR
jgi:hypothetical protein